MSEPCSQFREASKSEAEFIDALLKSYGFPALQGRRISVLAGREKAIMYSEIDRAKRKYAGGEFTDPNDGKQVFLDLLLSDDDKEFEIWLWKPFPGLDELALPNFGTFRPDELGPR